MRLFVLALLFCTLAYAEDNPKEEKPGSTIHTGHFVRNDTGEDARSLYLCSDQDAFEKLFGTVPPLNGNGGRKTNPVKDDVFEKNMVVVVVIRAMAITTYNEVSTKVDGEKLVVSYKCETGKAGSASYASPLIVSVPKGAWKTATFFENGKEVGTAK
jgi:hypothetical protein